jgi:hypothetical protein
MYNFLVHGLSDNWDGEPAELEINRIGEHTVDIIKKQFIPLTPESIKKLISLPCIFAYEESNKKNARVGWIEEIRVRDNKILYTYKFDPDVNDIPYTLFKTANWDFDIGEWEMSRTHWSIKNNNFEELLIKNGIISKGMSLKKKQEEIFFTKPLMAIIKQAIAELYSHTDIEEIFNSYGLVIGPNPDFSNKIKKVASFLDHVDWNESQNTAALVELLSQVYIQNSHLIKLGEGGQSSNPIFQMTLLSNSLEKNGLHWNGKAYVLNIVEKNELSVLHTLSLKELNQIPTAFSTYRAVKVLGEGGSGRVFLVKNAKDESFALKIISPEKMNSEKNTRFKNEIFFSLKINHPNIVPVLDIGFLMVKGVKCAFYVMPLYVCNFRDVMKNENDINIKLSYFVTFLKGLLYAHQHNCWHRDIKPENILFDGEKLILTDFGIAHINEEFVIADIETKEHSRLSNFQYASPEQRISGGRVDHRSDIYSVGLILNEIFTGTIPWGVGHKNIAEVAPEFSEFDEYVSYMLQHDVEKRLKGLEVVLSKILEKII